MGNDYKNRDIEHQPDERKPYRQPTLVEYGDIHELTQSGSGFGAEQPGSTFPTM